MKKEFCIILDSNPVDDINLKLELADTLIALLLQDFITTGGKQEIDRYSTYNLLLQIQMLMKTADARTRDIPYKLLVDRERGIEAQENTVAAAEEWEAAHMT